MILGKPSKNKEKNSGWKFLKSKEDTEKNHNENASFRKKFHVHCYLELEAQQGQHFTCE